MSARATRLTLALLLSLALPQPAPAASSTPPLSGAGGQTVAAAPELYDRATRHLREGHWYEDAIAQLSEAIRQDPANASYRLALGCANADRAASLAYAAMYVKMLADAHAQYAQQVKDWEAAQKNPGD